MNGQAVTWWANHGSVVKHATEGTTTAVCGQELHRQARQVGRNSYPARPCKRCMPRIADDQLVSLREHVPWTPETPTPAAASRALTIGADA